MLAEAGYPRPLLQPDLKGTSRRQWQRRQCRVHAQKALGRRRRPRETRCVAEPGAARASPTRTRSVSTTATWTSFGSIPPSRLCPMDCPTTEEAPVAEGLQGCFRGAASPRSGHHAALVCRATTGPVRASAAGRWLSAGTQGQQKNWTEKQ